MQVSFELMTCTQYSTNCSLHSPGKLGGQMSARANEDTDLGEDQKNLTALFLIEIEV